MIHIYHALNYALWVLGAIQVALHIVWHVRRAR